MQIHPSTKKLIDRLYDMTLERKIEWKQGDNGAVVFDTERYRVSLVGSPTEVILSSEAGAELDKADHDELSNTLLDDGTTYAEYVGQLHKEAHRIARGAESAIDDVLATLDQDLDVLPEDTGETETKVDAFRAGAPAVFEEAVSEPSLEDLSSEQVADAVASLANDVNSAETTAADIEPASIEVAPAPPVVDTTVEDEVPELPEMTPSVTEPPVAEDTTQPADIAEPEFEEPVAAADPIESGIAQPDIDAAPVPTDTPVSEELPPAEPEPQPVPPPPPPQTPSPAASAARSAVLSGGPLGGFGGFGQPAFAPREPAAPPAQPNVPPTPEPVAEAPAAEENPVPETPPAPTIPTAPPTSGGYVPTSTFSTVPLTTAAPRPPEPPSIPPAPPVPEIPAPDAAPSQSVNESRIADVIGSISEIVEEGASEESGETVETATVADGIAPRAPDLGAAALGAAGGGLNSLREKSIGVIDEAGEIIRGPAEPQTPPPPPEPEAEAKPAADSSEDETPKPPTKRFNPWR